MTVPDVHPERTQFISIVMQRMALLHMNVGTDLASASATLPALAILAVEDSCGYPFPPRVVELSPGRRP